MEKNIRTLIPFGESAKIVLPQNKKGGGRQTHGRHVSVYSEADTVMFHEELRDKLLELAKEQIDREQTKDPVMYASVAMIEVPEGNYYLGEDGNDLIPKKSRIEGMERLTMLFIILNYEQAQSFASNYGGESYKLSYSAGASVTKENKLPTSTYIEEGKGTFSIKNNKSLVVGTDNKTRSIISFFNPPLVDVERYDKDEEGFTIFENGEPKVIKVPGLSDIYFNNIGFVELEGMERGQGENEYLTAFAVSLQCFANPGNVGRIKKRKDGTKGEVEDADEFEDAEE